MIERKIEQISKQIKELNDIKELSTKTTKFLQRNDELKSISIELSKVLDIVLLFREMGIQVDIEEKFTNFIMSFNEMKLKWNDDKNSILLQNSFTTRNNISSIYNETYQELFNKWQNFVNEKKTNVNSEQLNILVKIPELEAKVLELKKCLERISLLRESFPSKTNDFELVISISNEMSKLWSQLSSEKIPEEVLNFLKQAGSYEGIRLSEINSNILFWLTEHNLTQLCQVRFR